MKHLYVSTPVNTFLVFNCNGAVTQQINTCTQQMLICRYNHVYLYDIFAYENINVMTFKCIFGHYVNKRFVERIPQFHAEYRYEHCSHIYADIFSVLRAEYNGIDCMNNC